jgi:hypothetical protein
VIQHFAHEELGHVRIGDEGLHLSLDEAPDLEVWRHVGTETAHGTADQPGYQTLEHDVVETLFVAEVVVEQR